MVKVSIFFTTFIVVFVVGFFLTHKTTPNICIEQHQAQYRASAKLVGYNQSLADLAAREACSK